MQSPRRCSQEGVSVAEEVALNSVHRDQCEEIQGSALFAHQERRPSKSNMSKQVRSLPGSKAAVADGKFQSADRTRTVLGMVNAKPRSTLVENSTIINKINPIDTQGKALNLDLKVDDSGAPDLKRS